MKKKSLELSPLQPWLVVVQHKFSLQRMRLLCLGASPSQAQYHVLVSNHLGSDWDVVDTMIVKDNTFICSALIISEDYEKAIPLK